MVPHAVVDSVIDEVTPLLSKGDILIEAVIHIIKSLFADMSN